MAHSAHCTRNALLRAIIAHAVAGGSVEPFLRFLPEKRVRT